jgi:hypothetical protein
MEIKMFRLFLTALIVLSFLGSCKSQNLDSQDDQDLPETNPVTLSK